MLINREPARPSGFGFPLMHTVGKPSAGQGPAAGGELPAAGPPGLCSDIAHGPLHGVPLSVAVRAQVGDVTLRRARSERDWVAVDGARVTARSCSSLMASPPLLDNTFR